MHEPPVVLNNTPLVVFYGLGRLELLRGLFGKVTIPSAVREEFLATESASRRAALDHASCIETRAISDTRRARSFSDLDRGEAEVLALAMEVDARLVVLDEKRARVHARRLGFRLTGSLGLLLLAKEIELLESIRPEVESLQSMGFFLDPRLVAEVLARAGEA